MADKKILISVFLIIISIVLLASLTLANPGPTPEVHHGLDEIVDNNGNSVDRNNNGIVDWAESSMFNTANFTCNTAGSARENSCAISIPSAQRPLKFCFVEKYRSCRDCRYTISGNVITLYADEERLHTDDCFCDIKCAY